MLKEIEFYTGHVFVEVIGDDGEIIESWYVDMSDKFSRMGNLELINIVYHNSGCEIRSTPVELEGDLSKYRFATSSTVSNKFEGTVKVIVRSGATGDCVTAEEVDMADPEAPAYTRRLFHDAMNLGRTLTTAAVKK